MSRTANITLHLQCAFVEISQHTPDLFFRLCRRACGIARAMSPFYK
jgi:hypothetical protein